MEHFDELLRQVPALVTLMEQNDLRLEERAVEFIRQLEESARQYRLPLESKFALIRGRILAGMEISGTRRYSRKELKKAENQFILSQLEAACTSVEAYFEESRRLFGECEKLCCQVLVTAKAKELWSIGEAQEVSGDKILSLLSQDPELLPVITHVAGLAGKINAQILFDKTRGTAGV